MKFVSVHIMSGSGMSDLNTWGKNLSKKWPIDKLPIVEIVVAEVKHMNKLFSLLRLPSTMEK